MDKKISPIRFEDFRIRYVLKTEAPVKGSDEILSFDSYLDRFVFGLGGIIVLFPYMLYIDRLPTLLNIYIIIIVTIAMSRPLGYLTYRFSFYRYYRYYGD